MSFELVGVRLVAEGAPEYFGTMAKADKAVDQFGTSAGNSFKQMPGLADIATGAFHRIGAAAIDFAAQGARAIGGFFKDSITAGADFQDGMLEFQAVAGQDIDTAGLEQFHDLFLQLGQDLPVSTSEVQQAAIELVKGGIDPATVAAGGLEASIKFAAAAMGGDLAAAAEVSAKVVGGWADVNATAAERADLLTKATDLLTKAANASTVDVDDLALGLYNVQGTAKTAGLTLEETTTALAELAPRFSNANTAGTSFRNFLIRLNPTTKPAIGAMKGLGLYTDEAGSAFYDAQGNFIGVAKASELLKEKLGPLTDQQRTMALQTIFGNDAMNAAAAFAEMGADGYETMAASLDKANGVAANAALKQQSLSTAWANFQGTIEKIQIQIGEALIPVLMDLFNNVLQPGITAVSEFANAILGADDPVTALVLAIDTAMPGFKGFVDFLSVAIPDAINFLMEHLEAIKGALVAVGVVIAGAAVAGAIASLLNPITLVIGAVALLGAAWAEDWGGIRTTLTDFWETTGKPIFDEVVVWLGDNIPKAIDTLTDFWENTLLPALTVVWDFFQKNILPVLDVLVKTYIKAVEIELKILADFWTNTLLPALKDVWSFIDSSVVPLFKALANVQIAALKLALRELTDIWNDVLLPAITAVYDWFNDNIIPIFSDTGDEGSELAKSIRETLGPAFTWLGDNVLSPAVDWFNDISDAISGVVSWLNDLAEKINNLPSLPDPFVGHSPPPIAQWMDAIAGGAQLATGAISEIGSAIANLPRSLPSWMDSVSSGLSLSGGDAGSLLGGAGFSRGISSPNALAMRGAGMANAVYNQQRTTNLTYHTTHAPPASQSLALASALAGGS